MNDEIILQPKLKKEKVQWGIYIDKELHDRVKDISRRSSVSYNEAINQVLEAGMAALEGK